MEEVRVLKITLLGGDLRQCYAADYFCRFFDEVALWGLGDRAYSHSSIKIYDTPQEALEQSSLCVLPVRVSTDGVNLNCPLDQNAKIELLCLFDIFSSNSTILGGIVSGETKTNLIERGHRYINYFDREDLQIKNALLTAEGALALGITETSHSLLGSNVAVLGYGRIAKFLCQELSQMGANVAVFARKSTDRATAFSYGFQTFSFEDGFSNRLAHDFDIIYNTIPVPIVNEDIVVCMRKDAVFIDLASAPGGIDFNSAAKYGIKTVRAQGLPGKIAPKTAGEIIAETIVHILTEEEYIT